jgi:hypothetical protein
MQDMTGLLRFQTKNENSLTIKIELEEGASKETKLLYNPDFLCPDLTIIPIYRTFFYSPEVRGKYCII